MPKIYMDSIDNSISTTTDTEDKNRNVEKKRDLTLIEIIGRNITKYRKARKMTRRQLAMKVLIEEAALGFYERGQREAGMLVYLRICDALNITLLDLIGIDVGEAMIITDPLEIKIASFALEFTRELIREHFDEIEQRIK